MLRRKPASGDCLKLTFEWLMTQMLRWGQIDPATDVTATAEAVYRPDLYREAASALGLPVPTTDRKPEGVHGRGWTLEEATEPLAMGPDRFFDGMSFDPGDCRGYLDGFGVRYSEVAAP